MNPPLTSGWRFVHIRPVHHADIVQVVLRDSRYLNPVTDRSRRFEFV